MNRFSVCSHRLWAAVGASGAFFLQCFPVVCVAAFRPLLYVGVGGFHLLWNRWRERAAPGLRPARRFVGRAWAVVVGRWAWCSCCGRPGPA